MGVERLTRVTLVVRDGPSSVSTPPELSASSLFKMSLEQGQGPYKTIVASSASDDDEFSEIRSGVRIDDIDLRPDMCAPDRGWLWLVIERMGGMTRGQGSVSALVEVFSEERIMLGTWGRGDG